MLKLVVNKYDEIGSYCWMFDLNEVDYFEFICLIDEKTAKFVADLGLGNKEEVILHVNETYSFSHVVSINGFEEEYDFIGDVTLIDDEEDNEETEGF